MKIPDAKAAVDKVWNELQNLPARREYQVKSEKEVIEQAQKEGKAVHFATLLDGDSGIVGSDDLFALAIAVYMYIKRLSPQQRYPHSLFGITYSLRSAAC